jgi:HTH-type transcriptional regulator / antitoxin HigA
MTQSGLALRMGRPPQVISEIISGKKQITEVTALELERVLGVPASFWLNLESNYQLARARQAEDRRLGEQVHRLKEFPIRKMEHLGWIPAGRTAVERLKHLLGFLEIRSLDQLDPAVVTGLRVTGGARIESAALIAWLKKVRADAGVTETDSFSRPKFELALRSIRASVVAAAAEFTGQMTALKQECAAAGVAVVFVSELPKSGANGCAGWLPDERAFIGLSLRYKTADSLWFTFFHEACHILQHRTRQIAVDADGLDGDHEAEEEADAYARNILIPSESWSGFLSTADFSRAAVKRFAAANAVHPGVVVGRLCHEQRISWNQLSDLRMRLRWSART